MLLSLGYLITLSNLLISNSSFLHSIVVDSIQILNFTDKFIAVFYIGEVVGSVLSFPFSEV